MSFKIYTKTGDKGETSLIGGTRLAKDDKRIEAYGTVDELNSFVGLIRDTQTDETIKKILFDIQKCLFIAGSQLAADRERNKMKLPELHEKYITNLESEIDRMDAELQPLKNFILPGGHIFVSYCHIARCVCRRAERLCVSLLDENKIDIINIKYLNRLSDYFFTLARYISKQTGSEEILWIPED